MLYEMEGTFYARRTVRIPNRVRHKLKTETLSKGGHLDVYSQGGYPPRSG